MSAPLHRHLWADLGLKTGTERSIDNHYHLEMIAENYQQIADYQADLLRQQHDDALAIISTIDETNSLLSTLTGKIDELNVTAKDIRKIAKRVLISILQQSEILQIGFRMIAQRMMDQQRMLEQIADALRHPYEAKSLELLENAERALKSGMKTTGRDQQEWFKDALNLLTEALKNPVGKQNYVAWFQSGWLQWKYNKNVRDAEESFYQAARLSAEQGDLYYPQSLRHQAYMQYYQNRFEEAYKNIHKALRVTPDDHDILYDAARYAAKTCREEEAQEFLSRCIDLQPQIIVVMFTEKDFIS